MHRDRGERLRSMMFAVWLLLTIFPLIQTIQFHSKENFVLYPPLFLCNNGSFSFEFRTTTINGLMFYTKDFHQSDFIIVSIDRGKLVVEQKFGKQKLSQQFDQSVNDNRWYKIVFKRRSPSQTEIHLYSVALRNVESRTIKSKSTSHVPLTRSNPNAFVYIGGIPTQLFVRERSQSDFLFSNYEGFIRNVRYGICGCPERIQHPQFRRLKREIQSEICEDQRSLCSSSSCECLNVDEEPRYQCDCSNKTCPILSQINRNLARVHLDFTSDDDLQQQSNENAFPYPHQLTIIKRGDDHVTVYPLIDQEQTCMWDLHRCPTELTFTWLLSLVQYQQNQSEIIYTQSFRNHGLLIVERIRLNHSHSNLQFSLWLTYKRGVLQTKLTELPHEIPLFINFVYRSPSTVNVLLFGQPLDSSSQPVTSTSMVNNWSSKLSIELSSKYFQMISWSYDRSLSDCCAFAHNIDGDEDEDVKSSSSRLHRRDLLDLETCQCGALTETSLNQNRFIPKTISEYPSPVNVRTKYTTDEEDYTSNESISFAFLTEQTSSSQATTILAGFAYDNIYYVFDLEDGKPKIIFSQDDLPDLVLTTKDSTLINDGQWHRLQIERVDRKLRFQLDNQEQSDVTLPSAWQSKTNIFIGAELTPVPNGDFNGKLGDITIINSGRTLNLREEDNTDENDDLMIKDSTISSTTTVISTENDKILVLLDLKTSKSSLIGFLPDDHQEIDVPISPSTPFQSFSFDFRTRSNVSTLIQFDRFSLNIDVDGFLALVHPEHQAQRFLRNDEQKAINDGQLYRVHLDRTDRTIHAWLMTMTTNGNQTKLSLNPKKITVTSTNLKPIEKILLGPRNQFIGCLENLTFNDQLLIVKNLPQHRQQCPSSSFGLKSGQISTNEKIFIDQQISFKESDRPLIVRFDHQEMFGIFSFLLYTQEANSLLASFTDQQTLTLAIRNQFLLINYDDHQGKIKKIYLNETTPLNDGREHRIVLKYFHPDEFHIEIDGKTFKEKTWTNFAVRTIYFGQFDGTIRDKFNEFDADAFIGCLKDVLWNEKALIQFEHVHHLERLTNVCPLAKRGRKNVVSYVSPDVSFSMRDRRDMIELKVQSNDEFRFCQMPIKTTSPNGIITSFYSNDDQRGLILALKDGKVLLNYLSPENRTGFLLFHDNQTINDGQQHRISFNTVKHDKIHVEIDKRSTDVSLPTENPLFFDVVTIGGPYRLMSTSTSPSPFVGCFANVTYNRHPLLPEGVLKADRYDCFYQQGMMCDRQVPCQLPSNIRPAQFCGQNDCSMVCAPNTFDLNRRGLVRYSTQIGGGQREQIDLTIFTTAANSTLYFARDGQIQVSIVLQNYLPRFLYQNGPIVSTYAFPGRVRGDQWHTLQCQKTSTTLDLTFDDESRTYTNLTGHFSLFGDRNVHLCGTNFFGYVQDVFLTADHRRENLIQNCIRNPSLVDYDPSVGWNNRAAIPERTPCERINCLNGGYCIQPSSPTNLAYCHCPAQYTGYRCEQPVSSDPCVNYQCNHGTCQKDRNNQPYCSCYEGYGGSRCETQIDPCARVNCNHGRCEVDRGTAVCRCYQGYTGADCLTATDPCAHVSCNYGTCINQGNSYRCECQRGYEGALCDRPIDPCATFVCYHGGICHRNEHDQPVCQCPSGYRGANCYEVEEDANVDDDACLNVNCNYGQCLIAAHDGKAYCRCLTGYTGEQCLDIETDPCLRYDCYGGTCTNDRGTPRCHCPPGRVGSRCQDDICTMYPCANNGQCIPEGNSRRCICSSPYYGDDCREVHRPNPCDNVYCAYGQCRDGICECHSGYTGARCDIAPDQCAGVICNYGTCYEGRCSCSEGYTGPFCDTLIAIPPGPQVAATTPRTPFIAQTVPVIGPKKGQLIDYGRILGARAGPIGWILAIASALFLFPIALAFAARKCTQGACLPGGGRGGYVPVQTGAPGVTQNENAIYTGPGSRTTRDLQLIDQRGESMGASAAAASSGGMETTRIEQTREIVREYGGMDSMSGGYLNYPTMSSRYGDFSRENHHQQSSSAYSQQHVIETDYHAPPVGDFGYGGFRDTYESWEAAGAGGYAMNGMFADGGFATDYELSNINSVSMTPNGKYAIVGQSQGPPQIWDAVNGQLVSSMQGACSNCSKVALACSGTLLVGLASDGIDAQPCVLQIWDVNTGKPVQLTHQIKCATFTLSNNSNNLIMAGNQKYGRGISVGILDLNNSELTKEIKSDTNQSYGGTPASVNLTPDERFAIVACPSGPTSTNFVVFDLSTQQELVQPGTMTIDSDPRCSLILNNEQMLTGTKTGQLILWDIPTCQRIHTLNENGQNAHRDRITDLKLSPDRLSFVSTSVDGTAKVWDSQTKELISKLGGHKREITCSCISTNQLVATGSKDQTICLWRLQTGQLASTMPVGMTPIDLHMAAHNRTIVAIGDKDGERQLLMLRVVSVQR